LNKELHELISELFNKNERFFDYRIDHANHAVIIAPGANSAHKVAGPLSNLSRLNAGHKNYSEGRNWKTVRRACHGNAESEGERFVGKETQRSHREQPGKGVELKEVTSLELPHLMREITRWNSANAGVGTLALNKRIGKKFKYS
jgi:hypothetical protein